MAGREPVDRERYDARSHPGHRPVDRTHVHLELDRRGERAVRVHRRRRGQLDTGNRRTAERWRRPREPRRRAVSGTVGRPEPRLPKRGLLLLAGRGTGHVPALRQRRPAVRPRCPCEQRGHRLRRPARPHQGGARRHRLPAEQVLRHERGRRSLDQRREHVARVPRAEQRDEPERPVHGDRQEQHGVLLLHAARRLPARRRESRRRADVDRRPRHRRLRRSRAGRLPRGGRRRSGSRSLWLPGHGQVREPRLRHVPRQVVPLHRHHLRRRQDVDHGQRDAERSGAGRGRDLPERDRLHRRQPQPARFQRGHDRRPRPRAVRLRRRLREPDLPLERRCDQRLRRLREGRAPDRRQVAVCTVRPSRADDAEGAVPRRHPLQLQGSPQLERAGQRRLGPHRLPHPARHGPRLRDADRHSRRRQEPVRRRVGRLLGRRVLLRGRGRQRPGRRPGVERARAHGER